MATVTIDGKKIEISDGSSVLQAADAAGIYIPRLCSHPDLPQSRNGQSIDFVFRCMDRITHNGTIPRSFNGCRLCLVRIEGMEMPQAACDTLVTDGMIVNTTAGDVIEQRQANLLKILENHPHACLLCAQKEGCTREPCSSNVPVEERCCPKLGNCELERVADFIGVRKDIRRYVPRKIPVIDNEPLFKRDYNLCINCTRCVRACRDMRGVKALGFVYVNDEPVVGSLKPTYIDSGCKFCGACAEVCPTGAISDKDFHGGSREDFLVPCRTNCPARIDIPKYLRYAAAGDMDRALQTVLEKVPIPTVLGRVCFHPCEEHCRRKKLNEPIAICAIKRAASEVELPQHNTNPQLTGKKVAIIGGGPAGLSCAYYLSRMGHFVTIFDETSSIGGMLRNGIPEYRLPLEVLEKDMHHIKAAGMEISAHTKVGPGQKITLEKLRTEFDAVFIATGAQLSRRINLPGTDLDGVLWGMDFLRDIRAGKKPHVAGKVLVVGGGNVAIDAARTAKRSGAREVHMYYLEKDEEMPAHDWEIDEARREGILMNPSWGPNKIFGNDGHVRGMEVIKCVRVFDENGNFAPEFEQCVTKVVDADMVILAVGQTAEPPFDKGTNTIALKGSLINVNENMGTSMDEVYAGGDAAKIPCSVIEAVAMGQKAAIAIDKKLGGSGNIDQMQATNVSGTSNPYIGADAEFAHRHRVQMPMLPMEQRVDGMREVELGYTKDAAMTEAGRCLQCDLRLAIRQNPSPPEKLMAFNEGTIGNVPEKDGIVEIFDGTKKVLLISGTQNMRQALKDRLENVEAKFFRFEEDPMYTKRESELLQLHMQKHGKMPPLNDELGDLF